MMAWKTRDDMSRLIIEAGKTERHYWADIWRYRELFFFLSWRDILVRYKQTVIGILWAVLRPLLTMIVFTVVFGKLAKMPSEGMPYPVFVYVAMLPWQFFSSSPSEASNSLIANASMISNIYFPRLVIPASAVIVCFVDFLISAVILAGLMAGYHVVPGWRLLWLPLFTALALLASFGISLWLSALNVKYRDFRYIIPFIVQFGLYVSPVGFGSAVVPEQWRLWYSLNPVVGVIDGFRWCILGGDSTLYLPGFLLSLGVVALFLWIGITYFRRTERSFADLI